MSNLSLPSRAWSCQSLNEGVLMCAQIAGISLGPDELNNPLQAAWMEDGPAWCCLQLSVYIA